MNPTTLYLCSQKSVNALVAVRRLSSMTSLMNIKSRPSVVPSLATVPSGKEEEEELERDDGESGEHDQATKEHLLIGKPVDKEGHPAVEGKEQISTRKYSGNF